MSRPCLGKQLLIKSQCPSFRHECIRRRRPFGDAAWIGRAAGRLGLGSSLRPRGRPRKPAGKSPTLFGEEGNEQFIHAVPFFP
jgi:hypothetical protein